MVFLLKLSSFCVYCVGSIALCLSLGSSIANANPQLPVIKLPNLKTDSEGNYQNGSARGWYVWQVVDFDPNGVNCRATSIFLDGSWQMISMISRIPTDRFPTDIQNFPVVQKFPKGTVLVAITAPAGFSTWEDNEKKLWLRVSLPSQKSINSMCFVRANSKFIVPIPSLSKY